MSNECFAAGGCLAETLRRRQQEGIDNWRRCVDTKDARIAELEAVVDQQNAKLNEVDDDSRNLRALLREARGEIGIVTDPRSTLFRRIDAALSPEKRTSLGRQP